MTAQLTPLGYLYAARMYGHDRTVQATSRDHDGTIHCRVYSPGTDWHGVCCKFDGDYLSTRKFDLPIPKDGWSILRMVEPGEKLDANQ